MLQANGHVLSVNTLLLSMLAVDSRIRKITSNMFVFIVLAIQ